METRHVTGRSRTIWTADNLDVLRGLNSASVHLVYLDPPFNSGRSYSGWPGSQGAGASFADTWRDDEAGADWLATIADAQPALHATVTAAGLTHGAGMLAYLCMMAPRLLEVRRVLRADGSLYLHCDDSASAYLRAVLDAIMGASNFRNEVAWCYRRPANRRQRTFNRCHDTILLYTTGNNYTFSTPPEIREPYSEESLARVASGNHSWANIGQETMVLNDAGRFPEDWWTIPFLRSHNGGTLLYPTQKPMALLERIITASSNPGDVVLDPFMGSGTVLVAAEKLGRRWLGIDSSDVAARVTVERLTALPPALREDGDYQSITVTTDLPQRTDTG